MIINILGGGPIELLPNLSEFNEQDSFWIGVDRGVFTLLSRGITPNMAFGDFDSVSDAEMELIKEQVREMKIFKPEKDEPDMELALNWALEQESNKIRIFGATGGRLDHFFANTQLLLRSVLQKNTCPIEIIDEKNSLYAFQAGTYQLKRDSQKKYISFIPVTGSVEGLTLTGFKYPLEDRHIPQTSTLCISNELIEDCGTFSFRDGILLVIRSCD